MKYTRYDIKKRRNNNFVFGAALFSTLIFALIIGTIFSNILFKNSEEQIIPNKETDSNVAKASNENSNEVVKKVIKYIAVQGGVYKNASGAEEVKSGLMEYGSPFTVQDDKGIRVLLGIYSEENGTEAIKMLTGKNIANSKISFNINVNDNCDSVITAVISNELDILTKLNDKAVKSIQTDEFKKWMSSLNEVDKESKNYSVFTELKEHVNGLPKELTKDTAGENYKYIYDKLKKLSQS